VFLLSLHNIFQIRNRLTRTLTVLKLLKVAFLNIFSRVFVTDPWTHILMTTVFSTEKPHSKQLKFLKQRHKKQIFNTEHTKLCVNKNKLLLTIPYNDVVGIRVEPSIVVYQQKAGQVSQVNIPGDQIKFLTYPIRRRLLCMYCCKYPKYCINVAKLCSPMKEAAQCARTAPYSLLQM
jgi:hypothetical protein